MSKVGTEVVVEGKPTLHLSDPDRPMTVQDLLRHTSGLTYVQGKQTSDSDAPMKYDSIFRIYSMTKPLTTPRPTRPCRAAPPASPLRG